MFNVQSQKEKMRSDTIFQCCYRIAQIDSQMECIETSLYHHQNVPSVHCSLLTLNIED